MTLFEDKQAALSGSETSEFLAEAVIESEKFRAEYATLPNIIKSADMPWERSPDGLIKHVVHKKMHTRECCIEAYMQFLNDGERSGKHRHMWEELFFVVEGSGYDLHWDLKWDCLDAFEWQWTDDAEALRMDGRRLRLHPAVYDASALRQCRRGVPYHRHEQPHRQRHGF